MHTNYTALKTFISFFVTPTEPEWDDFLSRVQTKRFEKGENLVSRGKTCDYLYFILDGFARHCMLDEDGVEITTWFNTPGSLATDYAGFTIGDPQPFEIQALTPVTAMCISNHDLQILYDKSKTWERMGRLINQFYLIQLIKRNNGMLNKSARERFEEFSSTNQELFRFAPLKYIASYLNITIETLSRLRANTY